MPEGRPRNSSKKSVITCKWVETYWDALFFVFNFDQEVEGGFGFLGMASCPVAMGNHPCVCEVTSEPYGLVSLRHYWSYTPDDHGETVPVTAVSWSPPMATTVGKSSPVTVRAIHILCHLSTFLQEIME